MNEAKHMQPRERQKKNRKSKVKKVRANRCGKWTHKKMNS